MRSKIKGLLVCAISIMAILGIICIMSYNMNKSINEKTSISP